VIDAPGRQAHQAHAVLELGLPVQLEQRDVVVQRLRVVIVVDVRGGHAQRLGARASVFPGQVVVAHAHVDGVPGPDDAANTGRNNYGQTVRGISRSSERQGRCDF